MSDSESIPKNPARRIAATAIGLAGGTVIARLAADLWLAPSQQTLRPLPGVILFLVYCGGFTVVMYLAYRYFGRRSEHVSRETRQKWYWLATLAGFLAVVVAGLSIAVEGSEQSVSAFATVAMVGFVAWFAILFAVWQLRPKHSRQSSGPT